MGMMVRVFCLDPECPNAHGIDMPYAPATATQPAEWITDYCPWCGGPFEERLKDLPAGHPAAIEAEGERGLNDRPLTSRGYRRLKEDVILYGAKHPGVRRVHGDIWRRLEATITAGGFAPEGLTDDQTDEWADARKEK